MNKLSLLLSLFLFMTLTGFAQLNSYYREMLCYIDYNNYDKALGELEGMRLNETVPSHAWQSYKSLILLKKDEFAKSASNRDSAMYYAVNAKKQLQEYYTGANKSCDDNLKTIADKYYSKIAKTADQYPDSGLYYYTKYREIKAYTLDAEGLKKKDAEVYSYMAAMHMNLYYADTLLRRNFESGVSLYKKVLEIDSNYFNANMNLLAAYYNVGVATIKRADVCKQQQTMITTDWNKTEIPSLEKLLECIKPEEYEKYHITPPFRAALPYALKLYQLDPSNKIAVEALTGIYLALSDKKNYAKYKQKRDKLSPSKTH